MNKKSPLAARIRGVMQNVDVVIDEVARAAEERAKNGRALGVSTCAATAELAASVAELRDFVAEFVSEKRHSGYRVKQLSDAEIEQTQRDYFTLYGAALSADELKETLDQSDRLPELRGSEFVTSMRLLGVLKARRERRFGYVIQPPDHHLCRYARKAAQNLGIPVPDVFFMRPCYAGETADITQAEPVVGLCKTARKGERCEIYIIQGLDPIGELEVVGHEVRHAKDNFDGRTCDERAADDFGRKLATKVILDQAVAKFRLTGYR